MLACLFFFFFFQAEDGIRDADVTGVQTCALPISRSLPTPARQSLANPLMALRGWLARGRVHRADRRPAPACRQPPGWPPTPVGSSKRSASAASASRCWSCCACSSPPCAASASDPEPPGAFESPSRGGRNIQPEGAVGAALPRNLSLGRPVWGVGGAIRAAEPHWRGKGPSPTTVRLLSPRDSPLPLRIDVLLDVLGHQAVTTSGGRLDVQPQPSRPYYAAKHDILRGKGRWDPHHPG